MHGFYSFRECHYLKRTKIEIKFDKFILFTRFSANHDDQHC